MPPREQKHLKKMSQEVSGSETKSRVGSFEEHR
jgi:hypothetical protein